MSDDAEVYMSPFAVSVRHGKASILQTGVVGGGGGRYVLVMWVVLVYKDGISMEMT